MSPVDNMETQVPDHMETEVTENKETEVPDKMGTKVPDNMAPVSEVKHDTMIEKTMEPHQEQNDPKEETPKTEADLSQPPRTKQWLSSAQIMQKLGELTKRSKHFKTPSASHPCPVSHGWRSNVELNKLLQRGKTHTCKGEKPTEQMPVKARNLSALQVWEQTASLQKSNAPQKARKETQDTECRVREKH